MQKAQVLQSLQVLGDKAPKTYLFNELSSTMDIAKEILETEDQYSLQLVDGDSANGYLILAQTQTNARGRAGRQWHSPEGEGLYFTYAKKVEQEAEQTLGLSLAVGASICESLKASEISCGLKWPNDLIVVLENAKEPKKVGGILIETSISGSKTSAVYIGAGLNVSNLNFPSDIPGISLSTIAKRDLNPGQVLEIILPSLCRDLDCFFQKGFIAFRNVWRKHSLIFNARAKLILPEETLDCLIEDIASDGALVIKVDNKLRNIYSGEISQIIPAHQKVLSVAQTIDQYIANCFSEITEDERAEIMESLRGEGDLDEELVAEKEVVEEETGSKNLSLMIKDMKLGAKVKLGLLGNMAARGLLIRENSRQIRQAVMKNPRLTETEVIEFARNANLDKHVFQIIANDSNWMKTYQVQVAIVSNPKTPMDISIRWIKYLKDKELKILSKAKSIPSALSTQVRKLVEIRNKKPGGSH